MIYLFNRINFYLHCTSFFTFLEKVSKNRHPSRCNPAETRTIAPLSRSFRMTFSFINNWAIAHKELFKVVSNTLPANTINHLRFFILCMPRRFFGYFPFSFRRSTKKKKVTIESSNHKQNIGITT